MAADELSTVALERGRHGVDVVRRGEQDDGGRALRHVGTDLVEERVVELVDPRLCDAPGDHSADEPDREPRGPEERACERAGEGALRGLLADRVTLVVNVDVPARERPANDEPIATVVLNESDLVYPRNVADGVEHVGVRVVGAFDVAEHREG